MNSLAMTEARTQMLTNVRDGIVTFDGGSGLWHVNGDSVAGWAGRTLSALRRSGYIEVATGARNSVNKVGLTDKGEEALA